MTKRGKHYGGRLIGTAALTMLFWSLPLVTLALLAKVNTASAQAQGLAARWSGKNQSVLLALVALLAAIAFLHDYRQTRKIDYNLRKAMIFGALMGLVQWVSAALFGEHDHFWITRTAVVSLMVFGLIVLTRVIAEEVDRLEGKQAVPEIVTT